jgi:hypothetical protein
MIARTPELEESILNQLMDGFSLRQICAAPEMPSRWTIFRWMAADDGFATKCARARIIQADAIADDMADIEDRTLSGELDASASRVVLSSKQWRAAKLSPKKYGDRVAVGGSDDMPGIKIDIDPLEAARRIAFLLRKAGDSTKE